VRKPKDNQQADGKDKGKVEELKNQLVRTLADYDNLRKRTESEREAWFKFAAERIVIRLLPILDSIESAQNHLKDQGLEIALSEFKKVLNEEGLVEISPKQGDEFDPEVHEAIELVEAPGPVSDSESLETRREGLLRTERFSEPEVRPGGGEKGKIEELVLTGWKFEDLSALPAQAGRAGGKVVRPAKVKVTKLS